MSEARKLAMRKAKKLSAKPQPQPNFDLPAYKCWGKAGHAMNNLIVQAQRNAQKFEDQLDYAS